MPTTSQNHNEEEQARYKISPWNLLIFKDISILGWAFGWPGLGCMLHTTEQIFQGELHNAVCSVVSGK